MENYIFVITCIISHCQVSALSDFVPKVYITPEANEGAILNAFLFTVCIFTTYRRTFFYLL